MLAILLAVFIVRPKKHQIFLRLNMTIVYFNHHIVMLYFLNKVEILGKKTMLQQEFKKGQILYLGGQL